MISGYKKDNPSIKKKTKKQKSNKIIHNKSLFSTAKNGKFQACSLCCMDVKSDGACHLLFCLSASIHHSKEERIGPFVNEKGTSNF
jgi:hypothetical protein